MAIYHCNISVASRANGASAVAGAAYISRSKIGCERLGITYNFTRAHMHEELVEDLGVALPEHAPDRWVAREVLWNEVESIEKKADAQLARRIECALPDELNEIDQIDLARKIVADRVKEGHVVDACIHRNVTGHNTHLHMLEPLRSCDDHGFKQKSENVYTVRNLNGVECKCNALEFKELKEQGFEKIYKYRKGNEWRELTQSEAKEWENCKRHGKTPVQETRYLNNGWNDKEMAEVWRRAVAMRTNEALERAGKDERVDHRSYERQGIDRIPQLHEGSRVCAIERKNQQNARERGAEYIPVSDVRRENMERRHNSAILEKASEIKNVLEQTIRQARERTITALEREMIKWRARMKRACSILFQPRSKPRKSVLEHQRFVYAMQSGKRLRTYRKRLIDPSYRGEFVNISGFAVCLSKRDLTSYERSFLTPEQDKEYATVRTKEIRSRRNSMSNYSYGHGIDFGDRSSKRRKKHRYYDNTSRNHSKRQINNNRSRGITR